MNPNNNKISSNEVLVSVIVSTYNSERFIKGKIEDLINQTIFDKIEIIFIDSGSLENESKIIESYLDIFNNIKLIRTNQRQTIYQSWNLGIKNSRGVFITNSNTDDRLKANALEIMSDFLIENPDVALVYADQLISNKENERFVDIKKNKKISFPDFNIYYMLERCIIGSQPMWRACIHFNDNIWFDEAFEVCGDHDFELKVAMKYKIHHINVPLGLFYKSPQRKNKEYENLERNLKEVRLIQKNNIPTFIKSLPSTEFYELKKYYNKYLLFPLPILFLMKLVMKLFEVQFPKFFFHSVGFIYFMNILIARKTNDIKTAEKIAKRYLKYKNSDLILNALNLELD